MKQVRQQWQIIVESVMMMLPTTVHPTVTMNGVGKQKQIIVESVIQILLMIVPLIVMVSGVVIGGIDRCGVSPSLVGIKAVVDGEGILEKPAPEIRIKESTLDAMEYEVRFFILPVHISPNEARHVVNRSVIEHLIHSGITPAHAKEEIFLQRRERKALDASLDEDLYQLLTRTELFRKLNAGEFAAVFRGMHKRPLAEGEVLFRQGDPGESMFICLEGLLTSSVTVRGQEDTQVDTIRAGQHFGEGSIFKGTGRVTTVTAGTEALVYEIPKGSLAPLLDVRLDLREQLGKDFKAQSKRIKESWIAARQKKAAESQPQKKKSPMQKVMQTVFTGIFDGGADLRGKGETQNDE